MPRLALLFCVLHHVGTQQAGEAGARLTTDGRQCLQSWALDGFDTRCETYCCNPDGDSGGDWCFVAAGVWGYCAGPGGLPGRVWPSISVRKALQLAEAPVHENLATNNQAMGVWRDGNGPGRELVVALTHQFNDLDRRADDKEYVVAWESDGHTLTEVERLEVSCPNLEVTVPTRGPYVYEARLDFSPGSVHPECSCVPDSDHACPRGVHATTASGARWNLTSVVRSHFVLLENEWEELVRDPATMHLLRSNVEAPVAVVSLALLNATESAPTEPEFGCPGSSDEPIGGPDVTEQQLEERNMRLPDGHVEGKWCLVRRGRCSETAKVKVCTLSGAIGTIIVDHANFAGDQDITVRYQRHANEVATRPILFISRDEGAVLAQAVVAEDVLVAVGPTIAGEAPPGFAPGSGVTVHALGALAATGTRSRSFPELFGTVGWIEVSDVRDLLFVCLPSAAEVRIYDISRPLEEVRLLGRISTPCSRYGLHDYRVLDYRGRDGRFHTVLVDPFDFGNRLFYYDTDDPTTPILELELKLTMEADNDGLGQVRAGGPDGRYHLVTWHCSDLFCGDSHGDSLYVLDSWNFTQAIEVPLPMLTKGGIARDIACGEDNLCLVSLTWSGLVALDSGVQGTQNAFGVVASHVDRDPFSSADIPDHQSYLRLYSGAQKVYASKHFPRHFYVEHADFSIRPFRLDDAIRALQLTEIYIAEVMDYDETVDLGLSANAVATAPQEPGLEPPGFRVLRNVHMSNTTTVGKWFFFDASSYPGFSFLDEPVGAQQFRGSSLIWQGRIRLWNSRNGLVGGEGSCPMCNAHGRRSSGAASEQWQVGDIVHIPQFHQSWVTQAPRATGTEGTGGIIWVAVALLVMLVAALLLAGVLWVLYVKEQYSNRVAKIQLDHYGRAAAGADGASNSNVVVGKPVGSGGGADDPAEGEAIGPGPVVCRTPTKAKSKSMMLPELEP